MKSLQATTHKISTIMIVCLSILLNIELCVAILEKPKAAQSLADFKKEIESIHLKSDAAALGVVLVENGTTIVI